MSKENGFLQLRRGVFEHVRDGRMSLIDYAVHSYITAQADTRTGIWNGSAGALAGELSLSRRKARRFLERLSHGGYIKRFPVPGKHVCYPILIHKFSITDGQHRGEQLNAIASSSPVNLEYFTGQQEGEQRGQHRGEHVTPQKILETRNGRPETKPRTKPRAAKPAAPADPRYQPFVDFAYRSFEAKHGQKPHWSARDFKSLKALLGQSQTLALTELERRWQHYLDRHRNLSPQSRAARSHFSAHALIHFYKARSQERRKPMSQTSSAAASRTADLMNTVTSGNGQTDKRCGEMARRWLMKFVAVTGTEASPALFDICGMNSCVTFRPKNSGSRVIA